MRPPSKAVQTGHSSPAHGALTAAGARLVIDRSTRYKGAVAEFRILVPLEVLAANGEPLAELPVEAFTPEQRRLEELRLAALEDRIEADLASARHAELVPELEGLVSRNPMRERLRGQLMLALYHSGRQADALRAYQDA